ncbi:hypothetical protein [Sulfitobacter sp. HGT1]|uniref:hypothetical protein n=1 Tax=Sulfitobacter sp. HGT1 TaxID=2735435 RepID=UPI0020CF0D8C|nr:hypothetical protein [Sulfitobacter sp. HGT1]
MMVIAIWFMMVIVEFAVKTEGNIVKITTAATHGNRVFDKERRATSGPRNTELFFFIYLRNSFQFDRNRRRYKRRGPETTDTNRRVTQRLQADELQSSFFWVIKIA